MTDEETIDVISASAKVPILEDGIRVLASMYEREREDRKFVGWCLALSLSVNIWIFLVWAFKAATR